MHAVKESPEISLPALLRAARAVYAREIRRALAEVGYDDIPRNGVIVLGVIARDVEPMARIIGYLGVSKQSAGQLVDALVQRGYLERETDPADRRRLGIGLTDRGHAAAAVTHAAAGQVDARLARRVPPEWIEHTRAALAALAGENDAMQSPRHWRIIAQ